MSQPPSSARADTKFIVVLSDGMADFPLDELDGRTPLDAAHTPNMDAIAAQGVVGGVDVIPSGQQPGSDVGNLSVLGYDPDEYLTGRAPLEAASMGLELGPTDVAFRCNLVTLDGDLLDDYSAGHISSEEAEELIAALSEQLDNGDLRLFAGVQYRHILLTDDAFDDVEATPPHDIMGQPYQEFLPRGASCAPLLRWMEESRAILKDHPVNRDRIADGKRPANSIWLWGQGRAPSLPTFADKYGLSGAAISAVDLVRGIARYAGLEVLSVPGITGYLDTNYAGKGAAAVDSLESADFVYVHVEAPDEAAHLGDAQAKIDAIEAVDHEVVGRALEYLDGHPDTRISVLPDHVTAISTRTHAHGAVPFAACGAGIEPDGVSTYSEASATQTALTFAKGHRWMDWFLGASG